MPDSLPGPAPDHVRDAARSGELIRTQLAELRRLHLALADTSRGLKDLTAEGHAGQEVALAAALLEGYLGETGAFLENMRGRFEARLPLLRRGEPNTRGRPTEGAAHGEFWMDFSRLCVALRRAEERGSA
jgi:hypothetical protein